MVMFCFCFCVVWVCFFIVKFFHCRHIVFTFTNLLLVGTKISLFARIHAKTNYSRVVNLNEDAAPQKKENTDSVSMYVLIFTWKSIKCTFVTVSYFFYFLSYREMRLYVCVSVCGRVLNSWSPLIDKSENWPHARLRLRRDRRLTVGTLTLRRRTRVAQHVVIARHKRHASIVLLALHTLGGGLQVQDLLDLLDFGAQLGLNILQLLQWHSPKISGAEVGLVVAGDAHMFQLFLKCLHVRQGLVTLLFSYHGLPIALLHLYLPRLVRGLHHLPVDHLCILVGKLVP